MVRCRGVDSLATVGRFVLEQGYICQQQIHIVNIFISFDIRRKHELLYIEEFYYFLFNRDASFFAMSFY